MTNEEMISLLLNKEISSKMYGVGIVKDIFSSSGVCLNIVFIIDGLEVVKTFKADIAYEKKAIFFEDETYNKLLDSIIKSDHEKKKINTVDCVIVEKTKVSNNKKINELVDDFINRIPFSTKLIQLYDNEDFEEELYKIGFKQIEKYCFCHRLSREQEALLIVLLSFISMKYYNGNYYQWVKEKYNDSSELTRKLSDKEIEDSVRDFLKKYIYEVKYFDSSSSTAVPIIIGGFPHYRMNHLFKLSYDIYKKKLLFDEDVSDAQIADKVSESLNSLNRKNLISDQDKIKGTEYLMPRFTQSSIYSGYNILSLVETITHCIRLIIDHLTRLEDSFNVEEFYKDGFIQWTSEFDSNLTEKQKYEASRLLSRPIFRLKNKNQLYIRTGEYCIEDSFDPSSVSIEIFENDNFVEKVFLNGPNDVYFNDDVAMGGYIISSKEIQIKCSPINNLSYNIKCADKEVYNSKNRLFRKNLFFDGKGNEVKPGTQYDGEIFVIAKGEDSFEENFEFQKVISLSNCNVYVIEVNSKEVYRIDQEPYVFYKIQDPKLIGYRVPWAEFETFENGIYSIYKDAAIVFQASCEKDEIYISVDGKILSVDEIDDTKFSIFLFANEYNGLFAYLIKIEGLEPGFHNIKIYNSRTKKMIKNASIDFCYDPQLIKKFISKDGKSITFDLNSSFFERENLIYSFGTSLLKKQIFVKGLGHGQLLLHPSTISFSIDGNNWLDIDKKIYLCDLVGVANRIKVCGPSGMSFYMYDKDAQFKKKALNYQKEEENLYLISLEPLFALKNKNHLKILFEYGSSSKYINVWYTPYIKKEECKIEFDKSNRIINASFIFESDSRLWVIVTKTGTNETVERKLVKNGEKFICDISNIDKHTHFLTISLHQQVIGSFIKKYNENPLVTFSKLCIDNIPFNMLSSSSINYNKIKDEIELKIDFNGCSMVKTKICPSGFDKVLYEKNIKSGEVIKISIKDQFYSSYTALIYKPVDDACSDFEPEFIKCLSVKVNSKILGKILCISKFFFEDGTIQSPKNSFLQIYRICDDQQKKFDANITNKNGQILLKDVLVTLSSVNDNSFIAIINRKKQDGTICGISTNGKRIVSSEILM